MNYSLKTVALGLAIITAVPACTNTRDPLQRAAGGALIGAAAGGGHGAALGAVVGGVAGALTGVATTPPPARRHAARARQPQYDPPSGY